MSAKTKASNESITIMEVQRGVIDMCILGTTPMICNSMSSKVLQELLLPKGRKSAAEKQSTLKHNPYEEYRDSIYRLGEDRNTLIAMPSTAFKGALRSSAVDLPGSTKAQIGRLTYVPGDYVEIFGRPQLLMSVTRCADMNRTPDVRTRAIIAEWACKVTVVYTQPILKQQAIVNLMAAAGIMQGIGDWRPEKGKGDYGQFKIVSPDDKDFKRIIKQGRDVQIKAMDDAECYDMETEKMLRWFDNESAARGFEVAA